MSIRVTPTMLHSIDREGRIEEVSDVWLAKLGYRWDEVIGRLSVDFLGDESARYAREVVLPRFFATGSCDVEYDMRRKDGTLFPVRLQGIAVRSESGAFVRSIAVIQDLTELRALEHKMFETQKLESLGLMAGSIAHDFNNLLASIVGNVGIGLRHTRQSPVATSALGDIMLAASRGADLCRTLLAYSGRGRFEIETIDLDDLVVELARVLAVNVADRAELVLALARSGALIEVDATQIRQVVMNLVINAAESYLERGGQIVVSTSIRDLDATTIASSRRDVVPGRYVCLAVVDQGRGIAPEVITNVFDPFFSTKGTGRGLGLSAVLGIVRGHHGTLVVRSTVGGGTTFEVFLPVAGGAQVGRGVPPAIVESTVAVPRGTILVVDDDDLIRRMLAAQLGEVGYHVVTTDSDEEAVELADTTTPTTFLIDVTMPGISGPELAARLHDRCPEALVVLMSGLDVVDLPPGGWSRFLHKPFSETELLSVLGQP